MLVVGATPTSRRVSNRDVGVDPTDDFHFSLLSSSILAFSVRSEPCHCRQDQGRSDWFLTILKHSTVPFISFAVNM